MKDLLLLPLMAYFRDLDYSFKPSYWQRLKYEWREWRMSHHIGKSSDLYEILLFGKKRDSLSDGRPPDDLYPLW